MEGDIVRACFDGSERRLLLASSLGEILVYRFLQVLSGFEGGAFNDWFRGP